MTVTTPLQREAAPPTQPGVYWFHSVTTPWELLVDVYSKNGELSVCWLNQDPLVTNLKGFWRGPIRPFGETTSL
jgi:hypothetical protein